MLWSRAPLAAVAIACLASISHGQTSIHQKCGTNVDLKDFSEACAVTTRTYCSATCANSLAEINEFKECAPTLIEESGPFGLSEESMCFLLPGCRINNIKGLNCPKPEPVSEQFSFTFTLPTPVGGDDDTFEDWFSLAVAEAANTRWGNVLVKKYERDKRPENLENPEDFEEPPSRRTTEKEEVVAVKIYAETLGESFVIQWKIQRSDFSDDMQHLLAAEGVSSPNVIFNPEDMDEEPEEKLPMDGYTVPKYVPGAAVVTFHNYSPMKPDQKWNADPNTPEGKAYLENVVTISIVSIIVSVVGIMGYWIFLCGHNLQCCNRFFVCCNQKGAWGGAKVARCTLAIMFLITFTTMCMCMVGRSNFQSG